MNPSFLLSTLTLLAALAAPAVVRAQTQAGGEPAAVPEKQDYGTLLTPGEKNAKSRTQVMSVEQMAVGMDEARLGAEVPMALPVTASDGTMTTLQGIADGKPILLQLGYYRCPVVCSFVLGNLGACVNQMGADMQPGRDYHIVSLSIDPKETPANAAEARIKVLGGVKPEWAGQGWHFLVAAPEAIKATAAACGFRYRHIPSIDQYAHPGVLVVLSPQGKVMRFLKANGADLTPGILTQAVADAKADAVVRPAAEDSFAVCIADFVNIFPRTAKNIMMLGGGLTLLVLVPAFLWLRRAETRRQAGQSVPDSVP